MANEVNMVFCSISQVYFTVFVTSFAFIFLTVHGSGNIVPWDRLSLLTIVADTVDYILILSRLSSIVL